MAGGFARPVPCVGVAAVAAMAVMFALLHRTVVDQGAKRPPLKCAIDRTRRRRERQTLSIAFHGRVSNQWLHILYSIVVNGPGVARGYARCSRREPKSISIIESFIRRISDGPGA